MKVYDGSQTESPEQSTPERIKVGIAEYKVTTEPAVLTTSGLGSCIGIAVYDTRNTVAGLVHVMLPSAADIDGGNHAKFADTGIEVLIEAMADAGASTEAMEPKSPAGAICSTSPRTAPLSVRETPRRCARRWMHTAFPLSAKTWVATTAGPSN